MLTKTSILLNVVIYTFFETWFANELDMSGAAFCSSIREIVKGDQSVAILAQAILAQVFSIACISLSLLSRRFALRLQPWQVAHPGGARLRSSDAGGDYGRFAAGRCGGCTLGIGFAQGVVFVLVAGPLRRRAGSVPSCFSWA